MDLGNSRLKWARLDEAGRLNDTQAVEPQQFDWAAQAVEQGGSPTSQAWAISSVNPVALDRLLSTLAERGVSDVRLFRSARDVGLSHRLDHPGSTGSDRALAVLAANRLHPEGGPGLVVSSGTALTVERIDGSGVWQGGAIAPGLGPLARALHESTAQLPWVKAESLERSGDPPAWGASTVPALQAGLFWGLVGAVREILTRQAEGFDRTPWLVWTGGDAGWLSGKFAWPGARVVPALVLHGLALAAFGVDPEGETPS